MIVKHFYDTALAQGSFVIISEDSAAVIDPSRNPKPYFDFVAEHNATIKYVIETHPHADFVSSHLEIRNTCGATILCSVMLGPSYEYQAFDEGQSIKLGKVELKSINTPGHSPDSISILLLDENGNEHSVFTGDTLFIGDVGRPDLREGVGNIQQKREELAKQMYDSTRNKLMKLQAEVNVYPSHGAGSLCGKNLSTELSSTIGKELASNVALKEMSESEFVDQLLQDQPYIPKYFLYDVELNRAGAPNYQESIDAVKRIDLIEADENDLVIDTRPEDQFKAGFFKSSINIPDGEKFETWVGSIVSPNEKFYMLCENAEKREILIAKLANIGYESKILAAGLDIANKSEKMEILDTEEFAQNTAKYQIIDIRNVPEVKDLSIFEGAINIPLHALRERLNEIPSDKDIVVHCKGGYRSAVGSSIIFNALKDKTRVLDLSFEISKYMEAATK